MIKQNRNRLVIYLIAISTLIRLLIAGNLELGNDEVYYWTYALHIQPSYFDHPPMVGILIRLFTFNLNFNQEIFIRLTAITGSAINTWLIYSLVTRIKNEECGFYAALLYTSCTYTSIIAGLFILPDSPQVVFWLWSISLMVDIFHLRRNKEMNMILLGLSIGLCTLCKIHGIYLWFAATTFIILFERKWLMNPFFWMSILISAIFIAPIFIWNYQNHFITYSYHSQRVVAWDGIHFSSFLTELFGEIFYNNPINFFIIAFTLIYTIRHRFYKENPRLFSLLLLLSLPLIFIFWVLSLFRDTLPHWSGPGYIALTIFAAFYADRVWRLKSTIHRLLGFSNGLLILLIGVSFFLIHSMPGQIGSRNIATLGDGDFTLDMYGWTDFEKEFSQIVSEDQHTGMMQKNAYLISNKWFPAAHLKYYVAQPLNMDIYAFGDLFDIHHFAWLNNLNGPIPLGSDAYYVSPSNYHSDPNLWLKKDFKKIDIPIVVPEFRHGKKVRIFYVYRLKDYEGGLDSDIPNR
ncbi:MAG: hypothetical protein C5B52_15070 [Bacteroidetes bacterium]|nr:MAG: hypothetical protein C5B52_15070 [Bacteroidota bacterium]